MTKKQYKQKCNALFQKAAKLGVKLLFSSECFDPRRLNCLWYGGHLATINLTDTLSVTIDICGPVLAIMRDKTKNDIAVVNDKECVGLFSKYMLPYIQSDRQLKKLLQNGRLTCEYRNWIEYNGLFKEKSSYIEYAEISLSDMDAELDCNVLKAIEQALDGIDDIKQEICDVAKERYDIEVSDGAINIKYCGPEDGG